MARLTVAPWISDTDMQRVLNGAMENASIIGSWPMDSSGWMLQVFTPEGPRFYRIGTEYHPERGGYRLTPASDQEAQGDPRHDAIAQGASQLIEEL